MTAATLLDPEATILEATGRPDLDGAIAWIAEGHPLASGTSWPRLLRALLGAKGEDLDRAALRRVTAHATDSELDTSRVLFATSEVAGAAAFSAAVAALLEHSEDGSFGGLTAPGLRLAFDANPLAIEALCLAAGVSEADAKAWFGGSGAWTDAQLAELLGHLDDLVCGRVKSPIRGTVPARAPELMAPGADGWETLDELNAAGVSYGMLLSQRAANGPWLAHKNKTSKWPSRGVADQLGALLGERGIDFRRASEVGGGVHQRVLQALSGIEDKRVGVVALNKAGAPTFAVTFSAARDGGTARASGDGLAHIPRTELPHALVLVGLGWSQRKETDRLALKFDGLLFGERSIDELVECIAEATR